MEDIDNDNGLQRFSFTILAMPGAGDGISLSSCDDGECRGHSSVGPTMIGVKNGPTMFVFCGIKREFYSTVVRFLEDLTAKWLWFGDRRA